MVVTRSMSTRLSFLSTFLSQIRIIRIISDSKRGGLVLLALQMSSTLDNVSCQRQCIKY